MLTLSPAINCAQTSAHQLPPKQNNLFETNQEAVASNIIIHPSAC